MRNAGDQPVSAKTIERVVHDIGGELAHRRDRDPKDDGALAQHPERLRTWQLSSATGDGFAPASLDMGRVCMAVAKAGARPRAPA